MSGNKGKTVTVTVPQPLPRRDIARDQQPRNIPHRIDESVKTTRVAPVEQTTEPSPKKK